MFNDIKYLILKYSIQLNDAQTVTSALFSIESDL